MEKALREELIALKDKVFSAQQSLRKIQCSGFDECFETNRDVRTDSFSSSIVSSDSAVAADSVRRSSTQ